LVIWQLFRVGKIKELAEKKNKFFDQCIFFSSAWCQFYCKSRCDISIFLYFIKRIILDSTKDSCLGQWKEMLWGHKLQWFTYFPDIIERKILEAHLASKISRLIGTHEGSWFLFLLLRRYQLKFKWCELKNYKLADRRHQMKENTLISIAKKQERKYSKNSTRPHKSHKMNE